VFSSIAPESRITLAWDRVRRDSSLLWARTRRRLGRPLSSSDRFDLDYSRKPRWEIGKPQPELLRFAEAGGIRGDVLDVGCGSGENALYLSAKGHSVWGVDVSPVAIEIATRKARQQNRQATFHVGDAMNLRALGRTFDTVLCFGLLHEFSADQIARFADSVWLVVRPGGTYLMLALASDNDAGPWPAGHSKDQITGSFRQGWALDFIRPALFETRHEELMAWLGSFTRV
jgi:SAM-dependent methyltransferase